jgi:hypothetical protein
MPNDDKSGPHQMAAKKAKPNATKDINSLIKPRQTPSNIEVPMMPSKMKSKAVTSL